MEPFTVIFYQKDDQTDPIKDFLLSLDMKMRAKMLRTIELLAANGPELREPCSKPIGDGIFELRAKVGTDITRIFYFFTSDHRIVLTNGFVKKSNKTPSAEIQLAKRRRSDFLNRKERSQ